MRKKPKPPTKLFLSLEPIEKRRTLTLDVARVWIHHSNDPDSKLAGSVTVLVRAMTASIDANEADQNAVTAAACAIDEIIQKAIIEATTPKGENQ